MLRMGDPSWLRGNVKLLRGRRGVYQGGRWVASMSAWSKLRKGNHANQKGKAAAVEPALWLRQPKSAPEGNGVDLRLKHLSHTCQYTFETSRDPYNLSILFSTRPHTRRAPLDPSSVCIVLSPWFLRKRTWIYPQSEATGRKDCVGAVMACTVPSSCKSMP